MFPFFYRKPYNYYFPSKFSNFSYGNSNAYKYNYDKMKSNINFENIGSNSLKSHKTTCKNDNSNDDFDFRKPIFEIFGIKLYFDDILLVSLIFFLYNEGVKDQSLFIALILLLLS